MLFDEVAALHTVHKHTQTHCRHTHLPVLKSSLPCERMRECSQIFPSFLPVIPPDLLLRAEFARSCYPGVHIHTHTRTPTHTHALSGLSFLFFFTFTVHFFCRGLLFLIIKGAFVSDSGTHIQIKPNIVCISSLLHIKEKSALSSFFHQSRHRRQLWSFSFRRVNENFSLETSDGPSLAYSSSDNSTL